MVPSASTATTVVPVVVVMVRVPEIGAAKTFPPTVVIEIPAPGVIPMVTPAPRPAPVRIGPLAVAFVIALTLRKLERVSALRIAVKRTASIGLAARRRGDGLTNLFGATPIELSVVVVVITVVDASALACR